MFIKYDPRDTNLGHNGANIMHKYSCTKTTNAFYISFDSKAVWVRVASIAIIAQVSIVGPDLPIHSFIL